MYWCDLVCIYAGGDVPVTPLHSNLVSGKTGRPDSRHSPGIAPPHRSTLNAKTVDKITNKTGTLTFATYLEKNMFLAFLESKSERSSR